MKRFVSLGTLVLALAVFGPTCWAEDKPVDLKTLEAAKITLEKALEVAGAQGKPISAKFEIEEGKLQLSVYTAKAGKFSEVLVDYLTGSVAKVEPITEGDDLKEARAQDAAMREAKTSLADATRKALAENAGSRAVSVVPSMQGGRAVAAVTLAGAQGAKTVSEALQ
ncbi:MAG TPA: PepSY domain-containing protein [Thermoanaerobaculia bacterium]|nr:PepSY domain-containing protein [Thermoanaerobaculia bacterium]